MVRRVMSVPWWLITSHRLSFAETGCVWRNRGTVTWCSRECIYEWHAAVVALLQELHTL